MRMGLRLLRIWKMLSLKLVYHSQRQGLSMLIHRLRCLILINSTRLGFLLILACQDHKLDIHRLVVKFPDLLILIKNLNHRLCLQGHTQIFIETSHTWPLECPILKIFSSKRMEQATHK